MDQQGLNMIIKRTCAYCKNEFEIKKTKHPPAVTCSKSCRYLLSAQTRAGDESVFSRKIFDVNPYWIARQGSDLVGRL